MLNVATYASKRTGLANLNSTYNTLIGTQDSLKDKEDESGDFVDFRQKPTRQRTNIPVLLGRISSFFGYRNSVEDKNILDSCLTVSQHFLKATLLDISRRHRTYVGLNAAIPYTKGSEQITSSIVIRSSRQTIPKSPESFKSDLSILGRSSCDIREEVMVNSDSELPRRYGNSPNSSTSIISLYSNPNYGTTRPHSTLPDSRRSNQELLQEIINRRNSLRPITRVPTDVKEDTDQSDSSSSEHSVYRVPPLISSESYLAIVQTQIGQSIANACETVQECNRHLMSSDQNQGKFLKRKLSQKLVQTSSIRTLATWDCNSNRIPSNSWISGLIRTFPSTWLPEALTLYFLSFVLILFLMPLVLVSY